MPMSDEHRLHYFESPAGIVAVALPFDLDAVVADWVALRPKMIGALDERFTRAEWAYLITFLDKTNLKHPFRRHFGERRNKPSGPLLSLVRPRGPISLWLPNNVSMLGPLSLVLLGLTGNALRIKGGSRADDLTGAFLGLALKHLPEGELKRHLAESIRYEQFPREDARHAELAADAKVRVVFGSDEAAEAVESLPHPVDSVGCYFTDRRSEAWLSAEAIDDKALTTLLQVFAIYGQTGCTSPARVMLLDGDAEAATALRDRLLQLWPRVIKRDPPPHLASENVMARQLAAALGWDAVLAPRHGAVLACGAVDLPPAPSTLALAVVPATLPEAAATLPPNIQTIGYATEGSLPAYWLQLLASGGVKRLVPLGRMHHFGPVWDGRAFFYECFEQVELLK